VSKRSGAVTSPAISSGVRRAYLARKRGEDKTAAEARRGRRPPLPGLDILTKSRLTKINNDTSESEVMTPPALTA
jgi:hypothetical protein